MNAQRQKQAEAIFLEASELPAEQRSALLELRCNRDVGLRAEVASLLQHLDGSERFLDNAELRALTASFSAPRPTDDAVLPRNRRVGDYTILEVLGSGGMGVVYVAEQERPRRTVALKVIRRGLGSPSMLRRFEHEAEMLGRLQHPGIAQIFEAGAAEVEPGWGQQPFIAMELVKGVPLTEFAQKRGLGTRDRMELLLKVCDAVEHAHQRGVIHRDLKPGNILIDDAGQPKVLDFGVARAADADLQVTTLQTSVGQLIGTLPYMSPEQVAGDPAEVDTRSDVYALGVVLYQLLTGRLPHDVKSRSIPEAARVIRDEAPARLSSVNKALRGDVETIVAKSLEKDKSRRYQSAAQLGEDISRYLAGQPIAARHDSSLYMLRKQLRRYRGAVLAAMLSILALVAFASIASLQSARNRVLASKLSDQLALVESERTKTTKLASGLAEQLAMSNVERGRLLGASGSLRLAEDLIWAEHLKNPSSLYTRWALWELYCNEPCLSTLIGHQRSVVTAAFSGDGSLLATGDSTGRLTVWRTSSGQPLRMFEPQGKGNVNKVAFSPDGARVAAGMMTGNARLYEIRDGVVSDPVEWPASEKSIRSVGFTREGLVLTGAEDGNARAWRDGKLVAEVNVPNRIIRSVLGLPDGRMLTGSSDGLIRSWDLQNAQCLQTIKTGHREIAAMAAAADGVHVATGGTERGLKVWNLDTGQCLREVIGLGSPVSGVALSPDGSRVVVAGWWTADLYDVATGAMLDTLAGHTQDVEGVAFSDDGRLLATVSDDATVRVWEARPGAALRVLQQQGESLSAAAMSPAGGLCAIAGEAGVIKVIDARSGALIKELRGHVGEVHSVAFSPDGMRLLSGGKDGSVRLWDIGWGTCTAELREGRGDVFSVAFFKDGRRALTGGRDEILREWDLETGTVERRMEGSANPIGTIALRPDEALVAVTPDGKKVHSWDAGSGAALPDLVSGESPWVVTHSPDSNLLALGNWSGTVEIWDAGRSTLVRTLHGHDQLVASVAFSPDGAIIAAGSLGGAIKLWEVSTGRVLATLGGMRGSVQSLAFSPDGSLLIAAASGGTAGLWDLSYYERHIAGNVEGRLALAGAEAVDGTRVDTLRRWTKAVLGRSWPRWTASDQPAN
ncbi:MAG: protein kinase [Phycisphaerales bacterium]|nr:protein kinase [Phycisphaerales bacterium]